MSPGSIPMARFVGGHLHLVPGVPWCSTSGAKRLTGRPRDARGYIDRYAGRLIAPGHRDRVADETRQVPGQHAEAGTVCRCQCGPVAERPDLVLELFLVLLISESLLQVGAAQESGAAFRSDGRSAERARFRAVVLPPMVLVARLSMAQTLPRLARGGPSPYEPNCTAAV